MGQGDFEILEMFGAHQASSSSDLFFLDRRGNPTCPAQGVPPSIPVDSRPAELAPDNRSSY
jgi:hypothetical protein